MMFNRRQVLQTIGGSAAAMALGGRASAQGAPLIVGSYAGVFEKGMRSSFIPDFESRNPLKVELSIGGPSQWLSQVRANPDHPPVDVILSSPRDAIAEGATGLYDKMTIDKLPNLAEIPPLFVEMCGGYGVSFDYGACGFAYNTKTVKNPPKSIKEFIDRTAKGEWVASLPTTSWQATPSNLIWSFNDALGGKNDDITPFISAMKKMKKNTIIWTGLPDVLTQLQSGEADIALYTDGRTWAAHFSGQDWIRFLNPEEGSVIETICAMKPKNAKPEAWAYINSMLSAAQQSKFADVTYFGMTNSKIQYSDKVKDLVTRWEAGRLAPTAEIAKYSAQWIERWNKELGI